MTKDTKFKQGASGNLNGRPKGKVAKPISRLRSTLNKLKQLEPDAIEVIEKSLLGKNDAEAKENSETKEDREIIEPVSKSQVDTAKWIITSIASLTRTAIAEETYRSDLQEKNSIPENEKATGTNDVAPRAPARFETRILDSEED
jgi:hypothetical protein